MCRVPVVHVVRRYNLRGLSFSGTDGLRDLVTMRHANDDERRNKPGGLQILPQGLTGSQAHNGSEGKSSDVMEYADEVIPQICPCASP